MFDRVSYPARGRKGGKNGAATTISQDDATPMKGYGKQFAAHGRRVMPVFPGGAGYGQPGRRDRKMTVADLMRGYICAGAAKADYGLSDEDIRKILKSVEHRESDQ